MSGAATVFVDGACSGNPGPAGIGIAIEREGSVCKEVSRYIGPATNNIAEYTALITALEDDSLKGLSSVEVYTDSELVHRQMTGRYKVKNPAIKPLYEKARLLSARFGSFSINHVPREENGRADRLARDSIRSNQNAAAAAMPGGTQKRI